MKNKFIIHPKEGDELKTSELHDNDVNQKSASIDNSGVGIESFIVFYKAVWT